jgi:hypothetical protein
MSTAVATVLGHALTRHDVNALRQADDVHAHYQNGETTLLAIKRITEQERVKFPFADDHQLRITVNSSVTLHADDHMESGYATVKQRFGGGNGLFEIVRPGDFLLFHWNMGAGTNKPLREIGWVGDELELIVYRASDEYGRKPLKFLVDKYAGPKGPNRMCRGW